MFQAAVIKRSARGCRHSAHVDIMVSAEFSIIRLFIVLQL